MLNYNVYLNSLRMLSHRGIEEADLFIDEIKKENRSEYMNKKDYHNIGYNFERHIKAELDDIRDRFKMSYCLFDDVNNIKQFVIFGTNSKGFINVLTEIILSDHGEYTPVFNIFLNKDFNIKYKSRLDVMATKTKMFRFFDMELMKLPFHAYGSSYELLTEKEAEDILKSIHSKKSNARKIFQNDPPVKYLGFYTGQLLRVTREPMIPGSLLDEYNDYLLVV